MMAKGRHGLAAPAWARLLVLLLAAPTAAALWGCGGGGPAPGQGAAPPPSTQAEKSPPAPAPPEPPGPRVMSTVPKFRLTSEAGRPFGSPNLDGKVWIANFIFTRCKQSCPEQTAALAQIQKQMKGQPSDKDVRIVSFTVDPTFDTPQVLTAYAKKAGADASTWAFLTGKRDDIWRLGEEGFKLPVSAAAGDPGKFVAQSQDFILVDRARRIRGHYNGLDEKDRAKLLADIDFVLNDPPGPPTFHKNPPFTGMQSGGGDFYDPPSIRHPAWMEARKQAQLKTLDKFQVYHDFTFTDELPETGITFVNKIVEDGGKHYKGVHYDHGNGVVVADVDGDGLLDVYFVTQLGKNQLYRNLGGGKFEEIGEAAGVSVGDRVSVTASFADIDNDGDPDLYVTAIRKGNLLFRNDGNGKFTDISKGSGLDYHGHSSSAVFFDYDRDGLLDLFLCNVGKYTTDKQGPGGYYIGYPDAFSGHLHPDRTEQSILYHNLGGGKFEDVSAKMGLQDTSWTGAASPIDLNEDGWPDLYVLSMQGHDEYYENEGGKHFKKRSREIFPATPWGSMGIQVMDFENDGYQDIFITDMHTDMIDDITSVRRYWYAEKMKMTEHYPARYLATDLNHVMGNAFFHNAGGGHFEEISDRIGAENYWPWGLSVADLNADGWEDAFLTSSMNYPYRYGVNSLLLNNRGKTFLDSEFILGVEPRRDGRTSTLWYTLDCDGADKSHPGCRGRHGKYNIYGAIGSRSSVIFDLDNDGDLDIITNDFNSPPMVLISNLSEKKPDLKWLKLSLKGTKSNSGGIGARVVVKAGGRTFTRYNDGQSGYLSQSLMPMYFGLGDAATVDSVEVTWPSSGTQVVKGPIKANQLLTVTEE